MQRSVPAKSWKAPGSSLDRLSSVDCRDGRCGQLDEVRGLEGHQGEDSAPGRVVSGKGEAVTPAGLHRWTVGGGTVRACGSTAAENRHHTADFAPGTEKPSAPGTHRRRPGGSRTRFQRRRRLVLAHCAPLRVAYVNGEPVTDTVSPMLKSDRRRAMANLRRGSRKAGTVSPKGQCARRPLPTRRDGDG